MKQIPRENVVELEKKLNVKLPLDYVSHMLEVNGGMPEPLSIIVNE